MTGETDIVWEFNSAEALDQWVLTSDKDHNEGYSSCSLTMNNYSKGVFSGMYLLIYLFPLKKSVVLLTILGELNTRVPKDGNIKRSGYCNMRSIRARKSFKRDSYLDWTMYNVLVMRVRGDGRSYMLNLATTGYFDVMWNDVYNYVLFTRGGPYWQVAKVITDLYV